MSSDRIARLRAAMGESQCLLVSNLVNVRYLCGFTGSNGALIITADRAVLATDSRYEVQAANQTTGVEIVVDRDLFGSLINQIDVQALGIESDHVSIGDFKKLQERFSKVSLQPMSGIVESLRVVKDEAEIELITQACQISTKALELLQGQIRVGVSERAIAMQLEGQMRELGADDRAFDTIVASGPNSAIPHHEPTNREISVGDFVKIDFGAKVAGYHADCTRTFVMGAPSTAQLEIYEAVQHAQAAGRAALHAGTKLSEVVTSVMDSFGDSNFAERFTHGLGHGVGLAIHEDPFFGPQNDAKIERNTVITVEPGVYLPGFGGVRIEDTVVVTDTGYRNLTEFSYELIEL